MKTLKRIAFFLIGLLSFNATLCAQTQQQLDSRSLYSHYKNHLALLNSSIAGSEQYENECRNIIDIYPQLKAAAILNQKRNNFPMALAFAKSCVDIAYMPQFASRNLKADVQFPQFVFFVASIYYASKEYTAAAKYYSRYIELDVNSPKPRNIVFANLLDCFIQMGKTELVDATRKVALAEYPNDKYFLAVNPKDIPQPSAVISSDVDKDIPITDKVNSKTFAFIIGNENYQTLEHVPFARHDAEIMSEYCQKALGIPENHIYTFFDASYNNILSCIRQMKEISKNLKSDVDFIFYYSGHGMPDDSTREAYLLPVDADGLTADGCYSIDRLYSELNELNAQRVVVFLDACFTGARRDGGMLVSARGVGLAPAKEEPEGKLVVLSASSGKQTAYPYKEKSHGMFTYFLLRHIKDSNGNITLGELSDYVIDNVSKNSIDINKKSQTPTISFSKTVRSQWRDWQLE